MSFTLKNKIHLLLKLITMLLQGTSLRSAPEQPVISPTTMRTEKIEFEVCDVDDAIIIPFDQEDQHGMKYHLHVNSEKDTDEDRVILSLNKASCQAFAQIFGQLAHGPYQEGFHVHLGYEAKQADGRGIRIVAVQGYRPFLKNLGVTVR